MSVIGQVAARALDLAFPASCAGCGREGEPICAACRPGLDARLDLPPGVPHRPAGGPARWPPPARVVRAVQRRRPRCAPPAQVRRRAPAGRTARRGGRAALDAGRSRWRPARAGAGPRDRAAPARLRPGRPARRGGRHGARPARDRRPSSAGRRRPPSSTWTGEPGRPTSRARFARGRGERPRARPRPVGRPRRRRRDDRRDAVRVRARSSSTAARAAVSAITVARER